MAKQNFLQAKKKLIITTIISLITSLAVLVAGLAFNGYDSTLVKKQDLYRDYGTKSSNDLVYVKTESLIEIKTTVQNIDRIAKSNEEMLKLLLIHMSISKCDNPPCDDTGGVKKIADKGGP